MVEQLIAPSRRRLVDGAGQLETVWASFIDALARRTQRADQAIEIAASYPAGLTITGVAATGRIEVSAHCRVYPTRSRPLQAGATPGQAYGAVRYVYYDDATRDGGLVTFVATGELEAAFASPSAPHRHFVGTVTLPATSGSSNTVGKAAKPPGYAAP
jgi:hypothetical protein